MYNYPLDLGGYGNSLTSNYNRANHHHHYTKVRGREGGIFVFWFIVIGIFLCLLA